MGLLPVHSDAFWTKECADDIFTNSGNDIQRIYTQVLKSLS